MKILASLVAASIGTVAYAAVPSDAPDHPCCALRVESTACDPKGPLFKFRYVTEQLSPPPRPGEKPPKLCIVPDTAIPYGKGMLLGLDAGEFGGQLAYRDSSSKTVVLLRENVKAISTVGATYVLTGLLHLSGNEGAIYRIDGNPGKRPRVVLVANLEGSPHNVLASPNGISFQTMTLVRRAEHGRPVFSARCYLFTPPSTVKAIACSKVPPPEDSLKPKPLRGSAKLTRGRPTT